MQSHRTQRDTANTRNSSLRSRLSFHSTLIKMRTRNGGKSANTSETASHSQRQICSRWYSASFRWLCASSEVLHLYAEIAACDISSGSKPLCAQTYPSMRRGYPELRKVFPPPQSALVFNFHVSLRPTDSFRGSIYIYIYIYVCYVYPVYTVDPCIYDTAGRSSPSEPGTSSHPSHLCITIHFFREFPPPDTSPHLCSLLATT